MSYKKLFGAIYKTQLPFNEAVCEGLATSHMKDVEHYVDRVWRCAAVDFPPNMRYLGYEVCHPYETLEVAPIKVRSRRPMELSKSNAYLVKYFLELDGNPLRPIYLYLPYPDRGGMMWHRGARYLVSPSLVDRGLSVCDDHIFVGINRASITFRRGYHTVLLNGITDSSDFVYSNLYNNARARRSAGTARSPVNMDAASGHYMFCKYGLKEAFRRQGSKGVVAGYESDINPGNYPPEEWVIVSSAKRAPRGLGRGVRDYTPTTLRLAIPRDEWTIGVKGLATAFFYVVDHFTDRVTLDQLEDTTMWCVLMGHVIFRAERSDIRLASDIADHISNIDGYIDAMAREKFHTVGLEINDIYDLFVYMIDELSVMIANVNERLPLLYGKEVAVNPYVLKDIVKAIFNFTFRFKPGTGFEATRDGVDRAMRNNLRPRALFSRWWTEHPEVSYVDSPTDNLIHDISTKVVQQSTGMLSTSAGSGSRGPKVDHTTILNESFAEVGCINSADRRDPIGTSKLNMFVTIDEHGIIRKYDEIKDNQER